MRMDVYEVEDDLQPLVARIAQGDQAAFETLVHATSARLVRLSSRIVGDLSAAEDVVQESYVKAYQAMMSGKFDGRAKVQTWLYRIVTNGSIDWLRRGQVAGRSLVPGVGKSATGAEAVSPEGEATMSPFATAEAAVAAVEARAALAELTRWLNQLPEEQRVALVLSALEGQSNREIAALLGCSEGAVEQRLVRARTTLRKLREQS